MKYAGLAVTLALAVLGSTSVETQEAEKKKLPIVVVAGSPATIDMAEMLAKYNDPRYNWDKARALVSIYKYYAGNAQKVSPWNTGINTFTSLQSRDVFRSVTRDLKLGSSMEAGVIKPQDCLKKDRDLDLSVERAIEPIRNIYTSGGNVGDIAIDTATINCGYPKNTAGRRVGQWTVKVEQSAFALFGQLRREIPDALIVPLGIGDIEPYPAVTPFEHLAYVDAMTDERAKLGFPPILYYDIDIDSRVLGTDEQATYDLSVIIEHMHSLGIKVGVIVNGDDSKLTNVSDASVDTLRSANKKLILYKRLGLFEKVDRVIVQSWATRQTGDPKNPAAFDVPYNVPENQITLTWFVSHVVGCIQETESCEFPVQ